MSSWNVSRMMRPSSCRTQRKVTSARRYNFQSVDILNPAAPTPCKVHSADTCEVENAWSSRNMGTKFKDQLGASGNYWILKDGRCSDPVHAEREYPGELGSRQGVYKHQRSREMLHDRSQGQRQGGKEGSRNAPRKYHREISRRRHHATDRRRSGVRDSADVDLAAAVAEQQRTGLTTYPCPQPSGSPNVDPEHYDGQLT
eukprot:jgi/Ulvmu1/5912/UM026_0034.1